MGSCCVNPNGAQPITHEATCKLQSWGRVIIARAELRKRIRVSLKEIASIRSPRNPEVKLIDNELLEQIYKRNMVQGVNRRYLQVREAKPDEKHAGYRGQMRVDGKDMVRDGLGQQNNADGSVYTGMFENDQMCGVGNMTWPNGDVYQGEWQANKANGRGVFLDRLGSVYEGEWEDDLQNGLGREEWEGGQITFEGTYYQGQKNGRGRFEWADGSYYDGELIGSEFSGQGVKHMAEDGKTYEGEFKSGHFDGFGKLTTKDGSTYEGAFVGGRKQGNGTQTWPDGKKYIGPWVEDLQNGVGIQYDPKKQEKIQGEWKNGKRVKWLSKPIKTGGASSAVQSSLKARMSKQTF